MEIPELLAQNTTAHLNDPIPTHADLLEVEEQLTQSLPIQYKQFVLLGGLNDLRFKHDILSPSDILKNKPFVAGSKLIPFGSNGCGDLFCWKAGEHDDPPVYFWDHEEARCSLVSERFSEWLVDQRFSSAGITIRLTRAADGAHLQNDPECGSRVIGAVTRTIHASPDSRPSRLHTGRTAITTLRNL